MEQAAGQGSIIASLFPLLVLFAIFYFVVIRPQQQQIKKHQEMLNSLKKGDKVVTNGGLIVEIVKVEENFFKIKLNNNTEAKLDKESVLRKYDED